MRNQNRAIGLLRGSGTRMALWFYALMRLLRMKDVLKATTAQLAFSEAVKSAGKNNSPKIKAAVMDIEDHSFFHDIYIILRAVYPALRALRYCDSNTPMMDKIYYLVHRTSESLRKSIDELDHEGRNGVQLLADGVMEAELADELVQEAEEVFGGDNDSVVQDEGGETLEYVLLFHSHLCLQLSHYFAFDYYCRFNPDDDSDDDEEGTGIDRATASFGNILLLEWEKRKAKLEHDYAIAGWALSVMPEVRADVAARMTGVHRDAIENVIKKLHTAPCPNPKVAGKSEAEIIDIFWDEFKAFQQLHPPFNQAHRWNSLDATNGRSHMA